MIENSPDEVDVSHPLTKRTVHLYTGKKIKNPTQFLLGFNLEICWISWKMQFIQLVDQ